MLIQSLQAEPEKVESILEDFLEKKSQIISVSAWGRQSNQLIRKTDASIWDPLQSADIPGSQRQQIMSYLFSTRPSASVEKAGFLTSSLFHTESFRFPIIKIGLILPPDHGFSAVECDIKLDLQENSLDLKTRSSEIVALFDEQRNFLYTSDPDWTIPKNLPDTDHVTRSDNGYSTIRPFSRIPWFLLVHVSDSQISSTRSLDSLNIILFFLGSMSLLTLLSFLLSQWIDFPQKRLIKTATEMARGNFSERLPNQKNQAMDRLVRLFNYMAEEMDRLQKMDVSEIINEKNKTETILKHIADGVVVTDFHDRIIVVNSVAERWFGLSEKNILHQKIRDCIKIQPLLSLLMEVKDGRLHSSSEFSFSVVETHEKKIFQAHAARVHNSEDQLIGVVTVIRDITKEKEIDRVKTELVSMVAHELKSPLTSIYGFSELLLDIQLDDTQATEYAQVILNEATRLTDLVNKFLDLSRLESGRTEIHMNDFDLKQVVAKIIDVYQGQADKKEIKVIAELPKRLPFVYGDPDMIEQVLLNLFSNAVKYSPTRSKIGIEVKDIGEEIQVNVIDNGYGIPEDSIERIFDKFYRASDVEGTDEVDGTGLGLSLAKEIVEKHGGTIKVNSRVGVGSIFSFTIPKTKK